MKYLFTFCVVLFASPLFAQPCGSPPTINFNMNSQDVCPGEFITFSGAVIGAVGTIDYEWFPATSTTNSITVSPSVVTWYYLEITDDCFTVIDSVKAEPDPIILSAINVTNATNCPGQPGTLGSIQIVPDSPSFTYTLFGGGISYGPVTTNTFSNLPGGVTYFVHVENNNDCFWIQQFLLIWDQTT